jgi:hypothetical protein
MRWILVPAVLVLSGCCAADRCAPRCSCPSAAPAAVVPTTVRRLDVPVVDPAVAKPTREELLAELERYRSLLRGNRQPGEMEDVEDEEAAREALIVAGPKPPCKTKCLDLPADDTTDPVKGRFCGSSRKKAKTSEVAGTLEDWGDIRTLIGDLLDAGGKLKNEKAMLKLGITSSDDRKPEEMHFVSVVGWVYSAALEKDRDYHVMIGTDPDDAEEPLYLNCEVSGLPDDQTTQTFANLTAVRAQFRTLMGAGLPVRCSDGYQAPASGPVKVKLTGSLFYDMEHAPPKKHAGDSGHAPRTAWEIHPISTIEVRAH